MYLSTSTLNVNALNALTKRHRAAEWIRKQDPYICCLQETHVRSKDTHKLKVKGWNIYFMQMERERKAGVSVLISDKIDFKTNSIVRDKKGHHIMIKETI